MPRPQKCRRICFTPQYDSFYPENSQTDDTITLTLDEYEVIRLVDLEKKTHEQCSAQMDVSRTTVTEIYESARYKLAQCIVNGKRLIISGGNYRICEGREYPRCRQCMCHMATAEHSFPVFHLQHNKGEGIKKIAVTYENGEIFQHFGHTEQFKLYTIANGTITAVEVVDTNGSGHGALAGFLLEHNVDTLICGGIGGGAQNALAQAGIQLYGGVSGNADEAVNALLTGTLGYNPNVHCSHHDMPAANTAAVSTAATKDHCNYRTERKKAACILFYACGKYQIIFFFGYQIGFYFSSTSIAACT